MYSDGVEQSFFWNTLWIPVTIICAMFGWQIWQLTIIQEEIRENQMDTVAELAAIRDQLLKARSEMVSKIESLEQAVIDAGTPSPEVAAAVAELKDVAQALDDVVIDDVVVEVPGEEVPGEEVPSTDE